MTTKHKISQQGKVEMVRASTGPGRPNHKANKMATVVVTISAAAKITIEVKAVVEVTEMMEVEGVKAAVMMVVEGDEEAVAAVTMAEEVAVGAVVMIEVVVEVAVVAVVEVIPNRNSKGPKLQLHNTKPSPSNNNLNPMRRKVNSSSKTNNSYKFLHLSSNIKEARKPSTHPPRKCSNSSTSSRRGTPTTTSMVHKAITMSTINQAQLCKLTMATSSSSHIIWTTATTETNNNSHITWIMETRPSIPNRMTSSTTCLTMKGNQCTKFDPVIKIKRNKLQLDHTGKCSRLGMTTKSAKDSGTIETIGMKIDRKRGRMITKMIGKPTDAMESKLIVTVTDIMTGRAIGGEIIVKMIVTMISKEIERVITMAVVKTAKKAKKRVKVVVVVVEMLDRRNTSKLPSNSSIKRKQPKSISSKRRIRTSSMRRSMIKLMS